MLWARHKRPGQHDGGSHASLFPKCCSPCPLANCPTAAILHPGLCRSTVKGVRGRLWDRPNRGVACYQRTPAKSRTLATELGAEPAVPLKEIPIGMPTPHIRSAPVQIFCELRPTNICN